MIKKLVIYFPLVLFVTIIATNSVVAVHSHDYKQAIVDTNKNLHEDCYLCDFVCKQTNSLFFHQFENGNFTELLIVKIIQIFIFKILYDSFSFELFQNKSPPKEVRIL